jgi:hypothetical protein
VNETLLKRGSQIQWTCGYLCGVGTDPSEAGTGRSEVVTDLLKAGTDFIEAVPAQSKPVPSEHEVGTGF